MIGQTFNKRYKITSLLGEGGMGEVYLAVDRQTRRQVAVKILTRQLSAQPEVLERFRREAETLQKLDHPNIVKFVDSFEHKKQYVIVMEYVSGGSLYQLLKRGPLSIESARRIALELCDALIRSHHLNIIHRDIKPENVLLDKDGTPKLADFGVARITAGTRMTRTGTQVGTPYYMAPEAWEGKPVDAQADIWSLGVMLFEMLAGQVPFDGDTGPVVMTKVMTSEPPDLKTLRADVPSDLVKIITRMLTRVKSQRYQTMREVAVDLERVQLPAEEIRAVKATHVITEPKDTDKTPEKSSSERANPEPIDERRSSLNKKTRRKPNTAVTVGLIGFAGIIIVALLGSSYFEKLLSPVIVATETSAVTLQSGTSSPAIEPSPQSTVATTPTPLPTEITDAQGVQMALVPAGEFTMGSLADDAFSFCKTISSNVVWYTYPCNRDDYLREEPVHTVYLDNFYMDVFEVSNAEYASCVSEGVCVQPLSIRANRYSRYYDNEIFLDYPVLNVTWDMAKTYCEWRGARLPTEAEWEKAARGVDGFSHPWGDFSSAYELYSLDFYKDRANLGLINFNLPPVPVSSNPKGLSPFGLYNMAGNAAEWVADWYDETYYGISPYENPPGPSSGDNKVIRGGSVNTYEIRTTARDYRDLSAYDSGIGIRCALSADLTAVETSSSAVSTASTQSQSVTVSSIPPESILFEENFEDGAINGWVRCIGNWTIEEEPDGNHFWSALGNTNFAHQCLYGDSTLDWVNYAFESRIKFVDVEGGALDIHVHGNPNSGTYYALTIFGLSSMIYNQSIPTNGPGIPGSDVSTSVTFNPIVWYTIRVEIEGNRLSTYVNNVLIREGTIPSPLLNEQGGIGYLFYGKRNYYIDDIKVWLLN